MPKKTGLSRQSLRMFDALYFSLKLSDLTEANRHFSIFFQKIDQKIFGFPKKAEKS